MPSRRSLFLQPLLMRAALLAPIALAPVMWPSAARAQMDPLRFDQILAVARAYATDRSLINDGLRAGAKYRPFLYRVVYLDITRDLERLKALGSDPTQNARLVQAVMANVRFYPPEAKDAALDTECVAKDVEKSVATFGGVSLPIFSRSPVREMGRVA